MEMLPVICVRPIVLIALALLAPAFPVEPTLIQVHQDFSTDPGWDNFQNRVIGVNMPVRAQDFGWSNTVHASTAPGEIGGRVENSRVGASYAMPLARPLTFNDPISVSGRVALKELGLRGVSYFGFFNSTRHTWRVYSSMAFRIWEEDDLGQVMFDWMSSDWRGRGAETAVLLPPDGSAHTFRFDYDPDARPDPVWRDALLEKHITSETGNGRPIELQGEEFLLERMREDEPGLTAEALHERLIAARDQGLIEYFHRHGQHRWWKMPNPEKNHGRATLQFDGETPYVFWFDEEIRNAPAEMDRFGLFNICRYGTGQEVYFGDLVVNGEPIDLAQDPHWLGQNNRATWTEPDFQSMQNFGWAQTNWAGQAPGEIGGLFWRLEPNDPGFGYYADECGPLTLDDPISFSGNIAFANGMTDASMYIGYFNAATYRVPLEKDSQEGGARPSMLGIALNDATSVGYYFAPFASDANRRYVRADNRYTFTPDRKSCPFTFTYDPEANNGIGRITYSIDGKEDSFDLTPEMRAAGATFDHFGLAAVRSGGNSVELYFDDLTYTVRREPGAKGTFHNQEITEREYPERSAGRVY